MPIDIQPNELQLVIKILAEHVPSLHVKAFGSRVNGTANRNSDLDLMIMTSTPLPLLALADLKDAFAESDLPFRVDIVDWAATDEHFRKIIEKRAVTIFPNMETFLYGDTA